MAEADTSARVTAEQVMEIISTELSIGQVNAFIRSAHVLVEDRLVSQNLSEAMLREIELYLAAHLVSLRDPRKKQVRVGDVAVTYQGESGMGLQSTSYGQQAIALDPSGILASMSQRKAKIEVF